MTHFEYASVAISLVYALTVSQLVGAILPSLRRPAHYFTHTIWLVVSFLIIVFSWWAFWSARDVVWTPSRFLYALLLPVFLSIAVTALTRNDAWKIQSFQDLFFKSRVVFFSTLNLYSISAVFGVWIYGLAPWWEFRPIHFASMPGICLATAGMAFSSPRAHAVIAILAMVTLLCAIFLVQLQIPAT